ncbi:hypothetical protein ACIQ7N_12655 [Lysinibacillus sp. NPDC095746]|uniref:hypothetical protein n=1 Tax=Lysinibacillus sp. NPDC095746 TaxID=3364134 RepID=UPI00382D23A8
MGISNRGKCITFCDNVFITNTLPLSLRCRAKNTLPLPLRFRAKNISCPKLLIALSERKSTLYYGDELAEMVQP